MRLAEFIVCPETLGALEWRDGGFWSEGAQRLYPVRDGLVFMGYPARDEEMIRGTMEEEREHQGLGAEVAAANLAYLEQVAPGAVEFLNHLAPFVTTGAARPRALELGCGNGWFSWLLAEAGFETWMCDFEANSLATGMNLEHPNLGEGHRFVTDARFAPIASGSMDLVVFKEFVHHVADYRGLFREAGRALRQGGTMALLEPVRSAWKTVYELRHPDPHEGHHITWAGRYLRAIRAAGMEPVEQAPIYGEEGNSRRLSAWMKERAVAAIDEAHPSGNWLTQSQLLLFGGAQLRMIARKASEPEPVPRPPMRLIDPDTLVVDPGDLGGYARFPAVLEAAAARLERLPAP